MMGTLRQDGTDEKSIDAVTGCNGDPGGNRTRDNLIKSRNILIQNIAATSIGSMGCAVPTKIAERIALLGVALSVAFAVYWYGGFNI